MVLPKPIQQPLEVWLGGRAPSELRRTGRLADSWLSSFTTPAGVAESITVIEAAAHYANRSMDPEHYGFLIPYLPAPTDGREVTVHDAMRKILGNRVPDIDPREIVATSQERVVELLIEYLNLSTSKFVLFPFSEPDEWYREIEDLAAAALPLKT